MTHFRDIETGQMEFKRPEAVKKVMNYDLSSVVGAVSSHRHNDHSRFVADFIKLGIHVLAPADALSAKGVLGNHFAKAVEPHKGYKVGGFRLIPFPLDHDVVCYGYLITHDELGTLVFITDTATMDYRFDGLNHILIEANYDDEILDENIRNGSMPGVMRPRLLKSHLELDSVKAILAAQDLSQVHNVVLLHLSSNNSNAKQFAEEITATVGVPVRVAEKGMMMELKRPEQ